MKIFTAWFRNVNNTLYIGACNNASQYSWRVLLLQ
jgi:hypothetical protein